MLMERVAATLAPGDSLPRTTRGHGPSLTCREEGKREDDLSVKETSTEAKRKIPTKPFFRAVTLLASSSYHRGLALSSGDLTSMNL